MKDAGQYYSDKAEEARQIEPEARTLRAAVQALDAISMMAEFTVARKCLSDELNTLRDKLKDAEWRLDQARYVGD